MDEIFAKALSNLPHEKIHQTADLYAALSRSAPIHSLTSLVPDRQFLHEVGYVDIGRIGVISQSGTDTAIHVEHTPNFHLVVVYGGSIALETAGGSTVLRKNEAALLPPGFRRSSGRHSLVAITLPPSGVAEAAASIAGSASRTPIHEAWELKLLKEGPMEGVIQSLLASLNAVLPLGADLVGNLMWDDVLLRAAALLLDPRLLREEPADLLRYRERRGRTNFDELIDYIRDHLDQPLRLSDLEARSHLSRWALQEAFRQRLDATPMEWIREQRLQRAMEHLQRAEERLPLKELALNCGYLRLSHFSRDFKKRFGISPSQIQRL
jgi:AraC-like DNA-binding protein